MKVAKVHTHRNQGKSLPPVLIVIIKCNLIYFSNILVYRTVETFCAELEKMVMANRWRCISWIFGWFSNRTGTSVADGVRKSNNWVDQWHSSKLGTGSRGLVLTGLLIIRAVADPQNSGISAKSREIPPKTRNTAKSARNISKYMSAKHI